MGSNCHTLCARDLTISWGNDCRYWRWCYDGASYVAELIQVWWLEVKGSYDTRCLPCGNSACECEVSFLVKLKHNACGWNLPVKISVCLPSGTRKEICVNLSNRPREQWFEISAGRFISTCPWVINFSLCQVNTNCVKTGLVIKGVKICCVRNNCCERKYCCERKTCYERTRCCGIAKCCCERINCCQGW